MALLKLLLATCLTLFVASALATVNATETYDLPFNATLQDELIVPKKYELQFKATKSGTIFTSNIIIIFETRKPISHIGIYTNGQTIQEKSVLLQYHEKNNSDQIEFKSFKYYTVENIYVMDFPMLSPHIIYKLNILYNNNILNILNSEIENIREDLENSHLYRIVDSSSGFDTISITSPYSPCETEITMAINNNTDLKFTNAVEYLTYLNYTVLFALPPMPIHQMMFLMGRNLEKTQCDEIIFWHSPKIRKEIEHAVSVSQKVSLHMKHYIPILPENKQWFSKPAYSIVSPQDEYPTVSNLGLIVYRQGDITFNKSENYFARKAAVEMTVSYEMSRQTLSYLVYPSSWVTKCLQESFAVYLHYSILDRIRWIDTEVESEDLVMRYLYVVQILQPSLHNEAVYRLKSISHGIDTTNEIDKSFFSRLYYNKASVLIYMLEHMSNMTAVNDFVSKHIELHIATFASEERFWDIITIDNIFETKWNTITYKQIMHLWLKQTYYPVINVRINRTQENLKITIRQHTFQDRNYITAKYKCENCTWPIFMYISPYKRNAGFLHLQKYWRFSHSEQVVGVSLQGSYDFVIFNLEHVGYYRVNYDNTNWIRIVLFMNYKDFREIHVLNRAQLIDDSYHFVMKGQLNWSIFLQLIKYLKRETSYIAWYPMINIMFYMTHFFHHSASEMIKPTLMEIFGSLLENIGYQYIGYGNVNDDDMTKSLRLLGSWWACKLGHPGCLEAARKNLYIHLHEPNKYPIKPWWKEWVYCNGVINKNTNIFIKMIEKYNVQFDKKLLRYMACTKKIDNVMNIFNKLKSNANIESLRNISNLEYRHISQFVKQHAEDQNMLEFIISNIEDIIPGVLNNSQFWADIVLNIYTRERLLTVQEKIMPIIMKESATYHTVNGLIDRQLKKIFKLFSTDYYI